MKKKVNLFLLILNIELCCALCHFRNLHNDHKVFEIRREEDFKEKNISIENEKNELNILIQESNNLKEKILKEIDLINKIYEEQNEEISISFKKKHEDLKNKENDLKEALKNEVTKMKEKLEEYYSETNKEIKEGERLNKIINSFEKDAEGKNIIKTLTYISYISNKKKEIEKLVLKLMKNLKISYKEDEEILKLDEYHFNGIKYPEEIIFKDIKIDSLKMSWKFPENIPIKIDEKKIKFRVEIKEEKSKDNFIQVYEGKENNCSIENLIIGTNYEIRICSIYEESISAWSPLQRVQTLSIDSKILEESKREKEFLDKIFEWSGYKTMELIYRGTRDGTTSQIFHEKCDNQGPTICLYKNEKGYIFGGYASISWSTRTNGYFRAPDCFIFTLTNVHETEPTKFKFKGSSDSVYHGSDHGAHFGGDIKIFRDFINSDSRSQFPDDYEDSLGKGKSIFTGDLNNNNYEFKVKDIEVFKLIK